MTSAEAEAEYRSIKAIVLDETRSMSERIATAEEFAASIDRWFLATHDEIKRIPAKFDGILPRGTEV